MTEQSLRETRTPALDWITLALILATYGVWGLATTVVAQLWLPLGIVLCGLAITQFSSVQHEVLHGHPTPRPLVNEALVFPALAVTVPYRRFRDTHLAHHRDSNLTDPYDDPESNFLDPSVWAGLNPVLRFFLNLNATLAGRIVLGPLIGALVWMRADARRIVAREPGVGWAWVLNGLGLVPVVAWLVWAGFPLWAYALAWWVGHGLLKIRTYLEHRAHDHARARTVVIEDRGPLALLFLNNNFHVVHHMHPRLPWYQLPAQYQSNKPQYLARNEGYRYDSYAEVFRRYFLHRKDPVPHPIWPVKRQ